MKDAIQQFLNNVPKDYYFDTHTVIEYLIQNHSDVYLRNFCKGSTSLYHGDIGQFIKKNFSNVSQIGLSWSKNIHDGYSEATLWQKK